LLFKFLALLAGIYLFFVTLLFFFQRQLLYFPDARPFTDCPAEAVIADHYRYYLLKVDKPRAWVIHFHGNAGRACDRLPLVRPLSELGLNVVLAEYPGYAGVGALPTESQILEMSEALFGHVRSRAQGLPILLFGESLGTGVATWLAASKREAVAGLILQTPFPSLAAVGQWHYPWLPVKWLLRDQFDARRWAQEVQAPAFIFHGTQDEVIPYELGQAQADNFPGVVVFWAIPDSRHNNIFPLHRPTFQQRLQLFLETILD
jgi:uncharacterized protein